MRTACKHSFSSSFLLTININQKLHNQYSLETGEYLNQRVMMHRGLNVCCIWHTLDTILSDIPMAPFTTVILSLLKHMRDARFILRDFAVSRSLHTRQKSVPSNDCDLYPSGPGGQNKPRNHNKYYSISHGTIATTTERSAYSTEKIQTALKRWHHLEIHHFQQLEVWENS